MEEDTNSLSPNPCPSTVTVRRNPHRRARPTPSTNPQPSISIPNLNLPNIPSFPVDDILSIEIPKKPSLGASSENLKVYLRIRPPGAKQPHALKAREKNVWPKNPKLTRPKFGEIEKKKSESGEVCVVVNQGSQSVTLFPPLSLQDSKRTKSEVFHGFSRVFSFDSSQGEVYREMVEPLVDDFLKGKSGMLAALGPSGSGKTYTVFGTPREPGMVSLALKRVFECQHDKQDELFSISIFEIYSDRGKVERILDLSSDGTELFMQQSNIKGLQEVVVSDVAQAESLIARAMLKRATSMTNTNSQSSRSQCVINIHQRTKKSDCEQHSDQKNSVLTIVDLAGAEREKRTGNQGSRLQESSFINNTVMVFGLCLRSLLEHQKNPKKPLQKHFQSSLLTRYLREYLEGKKRMALILTVKSGEGDYFDASFLLRQAARYMDIKFQKVEEATSFVHNKRHVQTLSMVGQSKRRKFNNILDEATEERKSIPDEQSLLVQDAQKISESDDVDAASEKIKDPPDLGTNDRNHQIMQNFAKAIWKVLKQYKEKLSIAENEIKHLNESLENEKKRSLELEKEVGDFRCICTCSKERAGSALPEVDTEFKALVTSEQNETNQVIETPNVKESKCSFSTQEQHLTSGPNKEINARVNSPKILTAEHNKFDEDLESIAECHPNAFPQEQPSKPILEEKNLLVEPRDLDVHNRETRLNTSCKPPNVEKPKRRLLPASTILLRDIATLGIEDELDKTKGSKVGKKGDADEGNRTQGSISLARLLQRDLHL